VSASNFSRMRVFRDLLFAGLFGLFLMGVWIVPQLPSLGANPKIQSDLIELRSRIALGNSMQEVDKAIAGIGSPHFLCRRAMPAWARSAAIGNEHWWIETPGTFGGGNKPLWIEFRDRAVVAIRVRTQGGICHGTPQSISLSTMCRIPSRLMQNNSGNISRARFGHYVRSKFTSK
jgi:hypothetical protein